MKNNKDNRIVVSWKFPLYLLGGFGLGGGICGAIACLFAPFIYLFAFAFTQPPFSLVFSLSLEALPTFIDIVGTCMILGGVATVILIIIAFIAELHMLRKGEIE